MKETRCETYPWGDTTYTHSGTYQRTYRNAIGGVCDSTITLKLKIATPAAHSDNKKACNSYFWKGKKYTASGNYTHIVRKAVDGACDSTYHLYLKIDPTPTRTYTRTACSPIFWNGKTYSATGRYTTTKRNGSGTCDSLLTLNLTLAHEVRGIIEQYTCHTNLNKASGDIINYTRDSVVPLAVGGQCDSILDRILYYKPKTKYIKHTSDGPYTWYGNTYSSTGTYTHRVASTTTNSCDSIITLNLKVRYWGTPDGFNDRETIPICPEEKTFTANGVRFTMMLVEAGTFQMGSNAADADPDEQPIHTVNITHDYYIGSYEVTQELWNAVMGSNPSLINDNEGPVENVSWNDVQNFIIALNRLTGKTFRLPTEAEWEFAARGGNRTHGYPYSGAVYLPSVAWYSNNSGNTPHEYGFKYVNELCLFDMSGNVYEWCHDWYGSAFYSISPSTDPQGPSTVKDHVVRGGSWTDPAPYCRVANRSHYQPNYKSNNVGFRLALTK